MRLLCDENVRGSIVRLLGQEGYDVERVQDALGVGFEDEAIVEYCRSKDRVLLTNDEDFFAVDGHPGVLFLDEQAGSPREVVVAIQRIERHVGVEALEDQVWHVPDGWT